MAHDLSRVATSRLVYRGAFRVTYAELNCISNFTFLKGASHADELVSRAAELGLSAIAIADTNSFAGIVRGHAAAKELGLTYLVAVRLILQDGAELVAYPKTVSYTHLTLPTILLV